MKKVGICSFYYKNTNFGGLLQAYAMVCAANKFGVNCEQICISNQISFRTRIKELFAREKVTPKLLFEILSEKMKRKSSDEVDAGIAEKINIRKNKFYEFEGQIPHSERIYTLDTIESVVTEYDCFICGSDQIWNWKLAFPYIYTLDFAPAEKNKIAYAASIASVDMPEKSRKRLEKGVSNLSSISVREKSALEIFSDEVGQRIKVVLDPTLLIDADEWRNVSRPLQIDEPYVFCYFLGTADEPRKAAKEIAKKMGLKIVTNPYILGYYTECDKDFGDIQLFNAGPQEFLSLIENASLVLTDSFHACAFSLQFQKNFYVFERKKVGTEKSMHTRIKDFLDTFELADRLVSVENVASYIDNDFHIDYTVANKILVAEREKSNDFLRTALLGGYGE